MPAENIVARCRWQSTFDQRVQATDLQDFLSRWSNTVLIDELERCFSERCPAHQNWQIENLHLDLGEIELQDLAHTLPLRLRARLHEAFDSLLAHQGLPGAGDRPFNFRVLEKAHTSREFLSWYLAQGTSPWWFSGSQSALQILDQMLAEHPDAVSAMVRELGQSQAVRKRVIWQFGDARLRHLIRLLEPWQGDVVCAYTDQLIAVQSRHRVPDVDHSDFRHQMWLHVLTYLLVDRGTLFNTISFMRGVIWSSAQHYRIDPQVMLACMAEAVQALQPQGVNNVAFFTAIQTLYSQERTGRGGAQTCSEPVDRWQHWQQMLRHGHARQSIALVSVSYGELFVTLADYDPVRMSAMLLREGGSPGVRQAMLRHLDDTGLERVACLLAPQDHRFIVAHAEHAQHLMRRQRWDEKTVWSVLLAYLMLARGSAFNRYQMVRDTLKALSSIHGRPFSELLYLLIHTVPAEQPGHRFELLVILRRLQTDLAMQPQDQVIEIALWAGVLRYLKTGAQGPSWDQQFARLLAATPTHVASRRLLDRVLHSSQLGAVSDSLLSQRLLILAGAANWPKLLEWLDPDAVGFCLALYERLQDGYRRGDLPCLAPLDLAFQLPTLLIEALPGLHQRRHGRAPRFEAQAFWRQLNVLLNRQVGVDTKALNQQLAGCHLVDSLWGCLASRYAAFEVTTVVQSVCVGYSMSHEPHVALLQLVRELERGKSVSLSEWVERQPDRYRALHGLCGHRQLSAVEHWMMDLLPAELMPPRNILNQWLTLMASCWQGAHALLEQQLAQIFWAVSFDARNLRFSPAQLLARMTVCASQRLGISLADVLNAYSQQLPSMTHTLWHGAHACLLQQPSGQGKRPTTIAIPATGNGVQDYSGAYLHDPLLLETARHLLLHGRLPSGRRSVGTWDLTRLLHDLFHERADILPALLGDIAQHPAARFRLLRIVPFAWLLRALCFIAPDRHGMWGVAEAFHRCLDRIELPDFSGKQCAAVLFEQLLERAMVQDWVALEPESLVDSVLSRMMRERSINLSVLRKSLAAQSSQMPLRLRQALNSVMSEVKQPMKICAARSEPPLIARQSASAPAVAMTINNAGLVMLQVYIKPLFSRLGLLQGDAFISEHASRRAVHCLQYLATGCTETAEHYLMINKLLCGLALEEPVEAAIELTDAHKETMNEMLYAVINHWPAIGKSSIEGLRGNWLVRDGLLLETQEGWDLSIKPCSYDLLLSRSPFTFSVIKFPWMPKALYVTWAT